MRIGVVYNKFGKSGGMEQYALTVIEALIQMGHTPVVFSMSVDETLSIYKSVEVHVWTQAIRWLPNKS